MSSFPFDKRYEVLSNTGEKYFIDSDEFIRKVENSAPEFRIGDDEVYTAGSNAKFIGYLQEEKIISPQGEVLFTFSD